FLSVRHDGARPAPFGLPLAGAVGAILAAAGLVLRLASLRWNVPEWLAFPVLWPISALRQEAGDVAVAGPGFAFRATGWVLETLAELAVGFGLVRFGPWLVWALERWLLNPLLIWPTDWFMEKLTRAYSMLLGWSLRWKSLVVASSVGLIVLAWVFVHYQLVGTELVPSEDQSRFQVQVICPVGSSI